MAERRNRDLLFGTALFVLALLVYARTWHFGLTYLDDSEIVRMRAAQLSSSSGFVDAFTHRYFLSENNLFYRPLVNLSFVLDAHLGGQNPWIYHFTNGLLHACVAVLLFRWLRALHMARVPAFLATALFAVHPMNVASVAWIPGRNDLLLGGLALAALMLLVRSPQSRVARVGHWLSFLAALLCKETALCLPLAFAALAFERKSHSRIPRGIGLGLGWLLVVSGYFWARSRVLSVPEGYTKQILQSAFANPAVLLSDLGKIVFPVHLQVIATAKDVDLRPGVVAFGLIATLVFALRHELRPRIVLTSLVLIVTPLAMALLASGFILLENRLYLPLLGLSVFLSECLCALQHRGRGLTMAAYAFVTSASVVLGVVTVRYSAHFGNREVFSEAAIKAAPSSYLAIWLRSQPTIRTPSGPRRHTQTSAP